VDQRGRRLSITNKRAQKGKKLVVNLNYLSVGKGGKGRKIPEFHCNQGKKGEKDREKKRSGVGI